jgi:hypothetical protein
MALDRPSREHLGNTPNATARTAGAWKDLAVDGGETAARTRIAGPFGSERRFGARELQERRAPDVVIACRTRPLDASANALLRGAALKGRGPAAGLQSANAWWRAPVDV